MLSMSEKEQEGQSRMAAAEGMRDGGVGGKDRDLGSNSCRALWVTARLLAFTLGKW